MKFLLNLASFTKSILFISVIVCPAIRVDHFEDSPELSLGSKETVRARVVIKGQTASTVQRVEPSKLARVSCEECAQELFQEGRNLRVVGTSGSLREAILSFRKASQVFGGGGNYREVSRCRNEIGEIWLSLGQLSQAINSHRMALKLSRLANDESEQSRALNGLAAAYIFKGRLKQAVRDSQIALRLSRAAAASIQEAAAYKNLGEAFHALSAEKPALESLENSLSITREMNDRRGEAYAEYALGYIYDDIGDITQAESHVGRAYLLWSDLSDTRGKALAQKEIGAIALDKGERQKALDDELLALNLFTVAGDKLGEASSNVFLGSILEQLGELDVAIDFHQRALQIYRELGSGVGEAVALSEVGHTYFTAGHLSEAEEYSTEWIHLSFALGDLRQESMSYAQLGLIKDSRGQISNAIHLYRKALAISRNAGDARAQVEALLHLGANETQLGNLEEAHAYLIQVSQLSDQIGDASAKATALYELARIGYLRDDLKVARSCLEAGIEIFELERREVANRNLRAFFFDSAHNFYSLYVDVLMRMYQESGSSELVGIALDAAERGRGRSMLDLVGDSGNRITVDSSMTGRERTLRELLNSKAQEQLRLQGGRNRRQAINMLSEEVRTLAFQYREIEGRIEDQFMGARLESHPLSFSQIEAELDNSTVALEYSLGEFRSYFWLIKRDSISVYALPSRIEIEQKVRPILAYLEAGPSASETDERQFSRNALDLSQVLFGPIATLIEGKRLIIIPDASLAYLPFGVLPSPSFDAKSNTSIPLVVEHEIVKVPSASVMVALRLRQNQKRSTAEQIAVFADPVFDRNDPRIQKSDRSDSRQAEGFSTLHLSRALGQPKEWKERGVIPRLPATRTEAETIRNLAPAEKAEITLDFDVNRKAIVDKDLRNYRIIHFATHATVDIEIPELSGIVLSLVDKTGEPQDGYLRLADIQGLVLQANLIVLSACSTNRGKRLRGEGVTSLSHGFLESGAGSVLASAWKVDDEATSVLMQQFYYNVLRLNQTPAMALRFAQTWMLKQEQWSAPYNWAAFELEGDWE
jgi:CHAT domain-containing protein/tetratricopeptide (TPR) repeat protein